MSSLEPRLISGKETAKLFGVKPYRVEKRYGIFAGLTVAKTHPKFFYVVEVKALYDKEHSEPIPQDTEYKNELQKRLKRLNRGKQNEHNSNRTV